MNNPTVTRREREPRLELGSEVKVRRGWALVQSDSRG